MFTKGQRVVVTINGRKEPGSIVYQRMNSLNLSEVAAVSVKLDSVTRYGYEGTLVFPSQVEVVNVG